MYMHYPSLLYFVALTTCADVAQLELDRFLTLHLRSRKFPSIATYIETVRVLATLSDRVAGRLSPRLPRPKVPLYI